ncbi:transcriptional regulator [Streptomyces albus subsp. chlorinus]|uniref:transcriptional regulator n=1 Tax=Streptomyces albus TaxID=1888 RepID=UPI001570FA81|nr:transcriptional regulator [Streptomyces albus]NSC20152.1 transcriptional regulator [Streptomyces albus subsp. chlorinus]
MLHRLAEEGATGAYTRAGGTLFLVEGRVAHAESPAAPGLEALLSREAARLRGHGRRAAHERAESAEAAQLPSALGRLPSGLLELCHRLALFDAVFFVLAPGGGPGRFRHGVRHGLSTDAPRVTTVAAEREAARRRALLDRVWPDTRLDGVPPVRTAPLPGAPVPDRRRAVLELVDGIRTATDIARLLGRPAFHTLVDLRRLAAAGLVRPGPSGSGVSGPPGEPPPEEFADPDIALLRRLRDALEGL